MSSLQSTPYYLIPAPAVLSIFNLDIEGTTDDMTHLKKKIKDIAETALHEINDLYSIAVKCIQPVPFTITTPYSLKCAELRMQAFQEVFSEGTLNRSIFTGLKHLNLIDSEGSLLPARTPPMPPEIESFLKELDSSFGKLKTSPYESAFKVPMNDGVSETLPARSSCYKKSLENFQILNAHIQELEHIIDSYATIQESKDQYILLNQIATKLEAQKEWSSIIKDFEETLKKIEIIKTQILPRYQSIKKTLDKYLVSLGTSLETASRYISTYRKHLKTASSETPTQVLNIDFYSPRDYVITPSPISSSKSLNTVYIKEVNAIKSNIPGRLKQTLPNFPVFLLFDPQIKAKTDQMEQIKECIKNMQANELEKLIHLTRLADKCICDFSDSTYTSFDYHKAKLKMETFEQMFSQGIVTKELFEELQANNLVKNDCLICHVPNFHITLDETFPSPHYTSFVKDLQHLNTYIDETEKAIASYEDTGLTADKLSHLDSIMGKILDRYHYSIYKTRTDSFLLKMQQLKEDTLPSLKQLQKETLTILTTFKAHTLKRASTLTAHYRSLSEDSTSLSNWLNPLSLAVARASRYIWHPNMEELTQLLTKEPYTQEMLALREIA